MSIAVVVGGDVRAIEAGHREQDDGNVFQVLLFTDPFGLV